MIEIPRFDVDFLLKMAHSPVHNYVVPGLTSYLIGQPGPKGTVRLFHSIREHQEPLAPHSYRFDFTCYVLRGEVRNRIWATTSVGYGDPYEATRITYQGEVGKYERERLKADYWTYSEVKYRAGDNYAMRFNEVHSIFFSRDALVLFLEGPTQTDKSIVLDPIAHGDVIPLSAVQPWMFRREGVAT